MKIKTADMKTYRLEYMRKYRDEHRAQIRANDRASRARTQEQREARRTRPEARKTNRERTAAYRARLGYEGRRDQMLRHRHGISLEAFDSMVVAQRGLCPICESPLVGNRPHVDHDHATGKNREVLCACCNQAIGMLKENPAAAERLAAYLRKHGRE